MTITKEQKIGLISFLESDITLNIAIILSFLGLMAMSVCGFLMEGMARIHLSVTGLLFLGLGLSLV